MPTYVGPFDVVQVDGKTYRRGDSINVSQARLDQLRSYDGYRFDTDQVANAQPIVSNSGDPAHPPNEFGVPADPNPKTNEARAQADAAVPAITPAP